MADSSSPSSGSGGGTSGGAGGYNIPISVSAAETFSVPQSLVSPTNIVFGSGNVLSEKNTSDPYSNAPATAVSSASERDASSKLSQGDSGTAPKSNTKLYLIIGGSVLALIAAIVVTVIIIKRKG